MVIGIELAHIRPSVNVFDYEDFRHFLRDATDELRRQGIYSNRKFAKLSHISSPTFLNRVLQAKKSINPNTCYRIAKALGLSRREAHYFFLLVKKEKVLEPLEQTVTLALMNELKNAAKHEPPEEPEEIILRIRVPDL